MRSGKARRRSIPGFSVCVEKEDGQRVRREYALLGNVVRYAGRAAVRAAAAGVRREGDGSAAVAVPETPAAPKESFSQRVKERVKGWFKKERSVRSSGRRQFR